MVIRRYVWGVLTLACMVSAACESKAEKEAKARQFSVDSMAALRAQGKTDLSNPEMGAKVLVRLFDDSVQLSHPEIPKGQVTFAVENHGTKAHELEITGPSGLWRSGQIPAGSNVLMSMILDKPGDHGMVETDTKEVTAKIKVQAPDASGVTPPAATTTN